MKEEDGIMISQRVIGAEEIKRMEDDIAYWDSVGEPVCEHVRSRQRLGYQGGARCFQCIFGESA